MSSAGGWWRRIAFSVVVALMALLGFAGPGYAEPVPTPAPAQIYSYDGAPECAVLTADGSERGPPRTRDEVAYDAVGLWSRGASACSSDGPTPPGVSTYDDPAPLVEVVRSAGTPPQRDRALVADLSSTTPGGVAANTGQKWAYRGVGRNHPGYDDALKGRVNPRNPNGTATPEQHNLGNTTDSPYTSWTRDPDIARRFAGPDGVVLRVPRGEGSPYKFEWSPDVYYEQEILIRGPVCGALIC